MSQLSIIVPAFNRADLLEICLGNLLAQLEQGDEILVVDDASKKETQRLLARFAKLHKAIHVFRLNRNYGQGHARNHGASIAKNPLLVFVDSDIDIGAGNLEKVRQFFLNHPSAAAVTGRLSLTHPYPSFFSRYKNTYMNFIFGLQDERVNFLYGSICAVRKRDFIPWPERYLGVEDSELGLRMEAAGKELHFLSDLEVIHFKNYRLISLLKNDFMVPFGFGRCFWLFSGYKAYLPWMEGQKFSHIKKEQVYSLFAALLFSLSLFVAGSMEIGLYVAPFALLIYLYLNRHFWFFLYEKEGVRFMVASVIWTFIDQLVMFAGAISGLCYHGVLLLSEWSPGESRVQEKS